MKRNANGNGSVRKISVARDGKTYTYWQARYRDEEHPKSARAGKGGLPLCRRRWSIQILPYRAVNLDKFGFSHSIRTCIPIFHL